MARPCIPDHARGHRFVEGKNAAGSGVIRRRGHGAKLVLQTRAMKRLPESKRETHVAATMPSTYISARSMTMHEHEKSSTCPVHWPWRPCPYVHLLNMSVKIPAICHTSPLSSTLSLQPCASMPHGRSPPPPHASPAASPTPELLFLSFFSLGPGRFLSFNPCRAHLQ